MDTDTHTHINRQRERGGGGGGKIPDSLIECFENIRNAFTSCNTDR